MLTAYSVRKPVTSTILNSTSNQYLKLYFFQIFPTEKNIDTWEIKIESRPKTSVSWNMSTVENTSFQKSINDVNK